MSASALQHNGDEGYAKLHRRLAARRDLSGAQKTLLSILLNLQGGDGPSNVSWPSLDYLAQESGRHPVNVRRMIKRLNAAFPSLILITPRPGGLTNLYRVNLSALPDYAAPALTRGGLAQRGADPAQREGPALAHPCASAPAPPAPAHPSPPALARPNKNIRKEQPKKDEGVRGTLWDRSIRWIEWFRLPSVLARERLRNDGQTPWPQKFISNRVADKSIRYVVVDGRPRTIVSASYSSTALMLLLAVEGSRNETETLTIHVRYDDPHLGELPTWRIGG